MTSSAPGKIPATPKGAATRAYLLNTAAAVFAEHGYAATTQADLIAASGLTKGAFYFYFPSKRELALAVLADQHNRWLTHVTDRVHTHPTPGAQLAALVPAMLDLIASEPAAWSITRLTRDLAADNDIAEQVREPTLRWIEFVADVLRRGQATGELRAELDPEHLATVLVAAFDGLKSLTDIVARPEHAAREFTEYAATLTSLVNLALLP